MRDSLKILRQVQMWDNNHNESALVYYFQGGKMSALCKI